MLHTKAAQIDRHVNSLVKLCNLTGENAHEKATSLHKRLRTIERYAHRAAENYCNIPDFDMEKAETEVESRISRAFARLSVPVPAGFFYNHDPRGYALKIESENLPEGFYTDWGGYGILAPDFS